MFEGAQVGLKICWVQERIAIKLWYIALVAQTGLLETAVGPDFAAGAIQVAKPVIGIPRISIVVKLNRSEVEQVMVRAEGPTYHLQDTRFATVLYMEDR